METGCSREEGAVQVEVERTAEGEVRQAEAAQVGGPRKISEECGEYQRRTWTTC
jgi:hypothetical protein